MDRWDRVGWVWEWERGRQGKGDIVDPGRMRVFEFSLVDIKTNRNVH